jgi:hypothetical protein
MKTYPYSAPIIMNDQIFLQYGGYTGTTLDAQRQAAYLIAEKQVTRYIDTPLLPTVFVDEENYFGGRGYLTTDYGYVSELLWVKVLDHNDVVLKQVSGTWSWAAIREDTFGYLYVQDCLFHWGYSLLQPYKFQFSYEAGLPTGTASQPDMLLALTMASQISLNEMGVIPANESTGDVGVTEFRSLEYSEKRKPWKNTVFGSSPKAAKVASLIDGAIKQDVQ